MMVAIRFGTLVRLLATVLLLSFILFALLTCRSTAGAPEPPPEPAPTRQQR
ncbi:hypothetical protein KIPE111705_45005 [Kibdelosporangium persicum]|uniref:hypothetical protein n=1 Tax=Kibdelosporangium persicum TaxID=2698649 RepID=UPI001567C68F|nr:hypothetical protein [Kibdelosporangium persicum]